MLVLTEIQVTALTVAGLLIFLCFIALAAIHRFHKKMKEFDGVNDSAFIGFEKPRPARRKSSIKRPPSQK